MAINSRQSGKHGERLAVKYLASLGIEAERIVKNDGGEADVQLKGKKRFSLSSKHQFTTYSWETVEVKFGKCKSYQDNTANRNRFIAQAVENGAAYVLYKPKGRHPWRLAYCNADGVWCWVDGEDRHKQILMSARSDGQ